MLLVNPMVTAMISFKIYTAFRRTRRESGLNQRISTIFTILVESAASWTILGLMVIIIDWLNTNGPRGGWQVCLYLVWCAVGVSDLTYSLVLE
jgi:hypothetical protein